ncbi:hypothetical protein KHHGKMAE_1155 [Methylobacterium persicinum]|nr:hypothetical protein KHHGKMAE_1155 [Methylobacterium persicinum]
MLARVALISIALASGAQAAAFDDLKGHLASCLRFEMNDSPARRGVPASVRVHDALDRCADDVARLERADGRRLRGDGGISPSTKEVILRVVSRSGNGVANVRY